MADQLPASFIDELTLTLHHRHPLSSDDLGQLFVALARDYSQLTDGRTLVVARIETGSLYAVLTDALAVVTPYVHDAVEFTKAARGIANLARILGRFIREALKNAEGVLVCDAGASCRVSLRNARLFHGELLAPM